MCALLAAGCDSSTTGRPVAAESSGVSGPVGTPLARLLPDTTQFPAGYPAVVLPPEVAAQAAGDLDGVGRGATVQPSGCLPPEPQQGPDMTAVAVGSDDASRTTLTVELNRTDQPLAQLRSQLQQCASVRVEKAGATTTVTTTLDPPPPVDADDTLALRRTVTPDVAGAGRTQSMQTLTGQVGDVRITVTAMTFTETTVDPAALDELFTTTVQKVRKG